MADEGRPIVAMAHDQEIHDVSVVPDQVDRKGELERVRPAQVRDKMPGTHVPGIQ
ncbi:hypothetical protein AB4Z40_25740 [Bosea sp. 2YAB26]|uniref:hypothetical protein n=1 Tax=Bosea sp. 2YAB26 TaxID=3237478 RepID=UPI003F91B2D5